MAGSHKEDENKVPRPKDSDTPHHSSTADIMQQTSAPTLTVTMISWNMENLYGGDINRLIDNIRIKYVKTHDVHFEKKDPWPDIIVIAGQEEGRDQEKSLGTQLTTEFERYHQRHYNQAFASFDTQTKPGKLGRVSLTVLSCTKPPPEISFVTYQGENSNKGGVGCHMKVGDKTLTFSGMHLDSKHDYRKIQEANGMVKKLEGFTGKAKYLGYEIMKANSTDIDVMMGDFNYRHVKLLEEKKAQDKDHYDPADCENFNSSSARGLTGFGFAPLPPNERDEDGFTKKTYNKSTKDGDSQIAKKRCDGRTKEPCFAEGALDVISATATEQATITPVIVVDTDKNDKGKDISDHKPVISVMELKSNNQSDFKRTQAWVSRKIKPYASGDVIKTLMALEDNPVGQRRLEAVYNYYMNIRNLVIQTEIIELHAKRSTDEDKVCEALMGKKPLDTRESFQAFIDGDSSTPGIVQQMIEEGDNAFGNMASLMKKETLPNLKKFVMETTEKVCQDKGISIPIAEVRSSMETMVARQIHPATPTIVPSPAQPKAEESATTQKPPKPGGV